MLETDVSALKRENTELKEDRDELKGFLTFLKGKNLELVKSEWSEYQRAKEM